MTIKLMAVINQKVVPGEVFRRVPGSEGSPCLVMMNGVGKACSVSQSQSSGVSGSSSHQAKTKYSPRPIYGLPLETNSEICQCFLWLISLRSYKLQAFEGIFSWDLTFVCGQTASI